MAHVDEAEAAEDELASDDCRVIRLPALESLPGETGVALDLFADRLRAVRAVAEESREERVERRGGGSAGPTVIIAPIHALMQAVPHPDALDELTRTIARADRLDPQELIAWLDAAGYARNAAVEEPGEY